MNLKLKCEYCGNEHTGSYGSGRFCSEHCARGFSSKIKRKEINKKVSETWRKKREKKQPKKCKSCGIEIANHNKKMYCCLCHSYIWNKLLFKKLNIDDTKSLKEQGKITLEKLKKLYFVDKLSSSEIYEEYNINAQDINNFKILK